MTDIFFFRGRKFIYFSSIFDYVCPIEFNGQCFGTGLANALKQLPEIMVIPCNNWLYDSLLCYHNLG